MLQAGPRGQQQGPGKIFMVNLDIHDLSISTASGPAAEHYRAGVTRMLAT